MANLALTIRSEAVTDPVLHPSIPPANGQCLWELLAKELRDEILRYAYGRQPAGLKIKMRSEFDEYNAYEEVQCRKEKREFKVSRPIFEGNPASAHRCDGFLLFSSSKAESSVLRDLLLAVRHLTQD